MILREWVQHGNADRGRYTNSRVFLVDPISRYAVFPLGMDYHLPHHLFVGVPHYKLKRLHELLLGNPEYAEKCRVVEGWTGEGREHGPSIVDVLGPQVCGGQRMKSISMRKRLRRRMSTTKAGVDAQVEASRQGRD